MDKLSFPVINLPHAVRHLVAYLRGEKTEAIKRDRIIDNALKSIREDRQGVVRYRKTIWNDASDFTVTGVAPTIVNKSVQLGTAFGSWDTSRVNVNIPNNDRDWAVTGYFKLLNLTQYGFALGKSSVNSWGKHEVASSLATNNLSAGVYPEFSGASTSPTQTGTIPTLTALDIVKVEVTSINSAITTRITNLLTGQFLLYTGSKPTNTGKFGFASTGATVQLISLEFRAICKGSPELITIGDSKTYGTIKDSYVSYADLMLPERNTRIFAGPSDRIEEAYQCLTNYLGTGARQAILSLGRNNQAASTFNATNQGKYAEIVDALKNDGFKRIIHYIIPDTYQDQTALTAYLQANFTSEIDKVVVMSSYNAGTDLSNDGVHLNANGQVKARNELEGILLPL